MSPTFTLRRLGVSDVAAYRDLRLLGLRSHLSAFGASFEEEVGKPLEWFVERLESSAVWGAWLDGDPNLAGVAALHVSATAKAMHKGLLWGMFVRPEARGTGLAASLAGQLLAQVRSTVEEVRLSVTTSNAAAVRLYARLGFRPYGVEPRALKIGGEYHDELLMALRF